MNVKDQVLEVLENHKGECISGGELAGKLNVSRNSIWKAVKSLQEEGYAIESAANRGYILSRENDILSVQSISKYLKPEYRGLQIEVHKIIDSTNLKAKEYAAKGAPEGKIVVAMEQTAGRGRMGRSFYSPCSSGVYISFLFRPTFTAEESLYLTTAAAVAAAESIDELIGVNKDSQSMIAVIKWVNDVFCYGKKVCGILTEASLDVENNMLDYAVTGIGFNIWEPEGGFPEELQNIAGAIFPKEKQEVLKAKDSKDEKDSSGTVIDPGLDIRSRLVAGMINHFWEYYEHLTERTYMPEYKRRSFLLGQMVHTLSVPELVGRAVDIDEQGHLIIELEDGTRKSLSSGEVSVRPVS